MILKIKDFIQKNLEEADISIYIISVFFTLAILIFSWSIINVNTPTTTSSSDIPHKLQKPSPEEDFPDPIEGYTRRFEAAFSNLMKEEGGYVNDPKDPGGETKYGISKRSYPHINIKNLTLEQAKEIYHRDYWLKIKGDQLHSDAVASEFLEMAVNMGPVLIIYFYQAALDVLGAHVDIDGNMNDSTLKGGMKVDQEMLKKCMQAQAMTYYIDLSRNRPVLKKFLKGWFHRVLY